MRRFFLTLAALALGGSVGSGPVLAQTPSPTPANPGLRPPPVTVTYAAGWNLVAGPAGTIIAGANGPLYTFQAGGSTYETLPASSPLQPGVGYWAYFAQASSQTLPAGPTQPVSATRQLPAGQFIMIGNPGTRPATVAGADVVYIYDPAQGYQPASVLQPGQGAWAFSASEGSVSISTQQ